MNYEAKLANTIARPTLGPAPESNIIDGLEAQGNALERLEETIGRLYSRLDRYLRPESPACDECSEKGASERSFTANALSGSNYRIDSATRRLRDLIDRVD